MAEPINLAPNSNFYETCKPILQARLEWMLAKKNWPTLLYIGPKGYKALESEGMEKRIFGMNVNLRQEEGFILK